MEILLGHQRVPGRPPQSRRSCQRMFSGRLRATKRAWSRPELTIGLAHPSYQAMPPLATGRRSAPDQRQQHRHQALDDQRCPGFGRVQALACSNVRSAEPSGWMIPS